MTYNVPEGYISVREAAIRAKGDSRSAYEWMRRRLDPKHPDMVPHEKLPTNGKPQYRIPEKAFEEWQAAHKVDKR